MKRTNPFKVSYAIDLIRQQAIAALGFDRAMNGGFRIHTTLDSKLQRAAEKAVRDVTSRIEQTPGYSHETFAQFRERVLPIEEKLNRGILNVKMPEPKYLQSAVLLLDASTGGVLAMVGGRDFKHSEYNRAIQARRPAGTVFTPFVFAAAFQNGIFPGETVDDACIDNRFVMVGGDKGILGEWGVEQADNEYEGPLPMRQALARGKNAATVRAGMRVGLEAVKQTAAACGIQSPLRDFANTFLGSSENTLEELTLAFSPFGQGGLRPARTFIIERIEDASGTTIFTAQPERVEALSPAAAYQVHSCLVDALEAGTGGKARALGLGDFPAAGKSGTAYG
ncbi:MAG: penicillin-binding transpeptidase domain-containing protein, partial [Terrimicrobiaceae bacterium]|nr:penicillin-binding transpeptidase domain-containing protein [Terrimicrobiaceae bacterium]